MRYKEFELILSSFKCNRNCPYCTAKITNWPSVDDNLIQLKTKLEFLRDRGITFQYFILCGNGEPSLAPYEDLKIIVDSTKEVNLFDEKRFQSSGNIFTDDEKLNLVIDDFIIEITRVSFDPVLDMDTLRYDFDYLKTDNFFRSNIRLNYVLTKRKSLDECWDDIKRHIDKYPNIKTVSLKTLNLNTRDNNHDNPYTKWIIDHGMTKNDSDEIIKYMKTRAEFIKNDDEFFDRYEWNYEGIPVTFYQKKLSYGISNVVYYGGELVNYKLQSIF